MARWDTNVGFQPQPARGMVVQIRSSYKRLLRTDLLFDKRKIQVEVIKLLVEFIAFTGPYSFTSSSWAQISALDE